jgi:7-cyano-7-deazaguanine reductase
MNTNHRPSRKVARPQAKPAPHSKTPALEKPQPAHPRHRPTSITKRQQAEKAADEDLPKSDASETNPSAQTSGLTLLGAKSTHYSDQYSPAILETFENRHQEYDYFVKFNCPEFTSLCPLTGQPDFANIVISYVPDSRLVESKSLKLYLFSFRNHGDFHEDVVNVIRNDLIACLDPKYIEVLGRFLPRGGLSIDPYCNYGKPGTKWEDVAWERLSRHDMYPESVDNR